MYIIVLNKIHSGLFRTIKLMLDEDAVNDKFY